MKTIKKWTNEERTYIIENLNSMSNKELAENLGRTVKMIGSYLWKTGQKRNTPQKSLDKKSSITKSITTKKKSKVKKLALKKFITQSESFRIDYFILLGKIKKCTSKNLCSALAGNQKLKHISFKIFLKSTTNEYLYFIEADDKSYFIKTGIYNGQSLLESGRSSKNELEEFINNIKEQEKN